MNKNAKILTVAERAANAANRAEAIKKKQRQERRDERIATEKENHRRNYIIGEMVCKHFPEVLDIDLGRTKAENTSRFAFVEAFISALANDHDLVQMMKERANQNASRFLGGELSSDTPKEPADGPNV